MLVCLGGQSISESVSVCTGTRKCKCLGDLSACLLFQVRYPSWVEPKNSSPCPFSADTGEAMQARRAEHFYSGARILEQSLPMQSTRFCVLEGGL